MTLQTAKYPPRVVIVGRPNVGKSTLFNRLYGGRRAITDPTPGVTRDALEENCSLGGLAVQLIDTGGVKVQRNEDFDQIVAEKSLEMLDDADLILFLVEAGGLTGEDQALIEGLRQRQEKILLVVNKSDSPEKDNEIWEYAALGWGDPLAVSASHGRNINLLIDRIKEHLEVLAPPPGDTPGAPPPSPLQLALVGKPNAGKSTLSNALTGSSRSLVSAIPGTTRDTVSGEFVYKGKAVRVLDTAGIRRKRNVRENVEYYSVNRALRAMGEADVTVLLVDVEEGLSDQDKKISAQAVKKGRALVMALNKGDLLGGDQQRLKDIKNKIRFQFPILHWAPLVPLSALKGEGQDALLDTIFQVHQQQQRRIETGELNRALREWLDLTPPPAPKGRPFRVKYLTQVAVKPVRFIAFVNKTKGFPDFYKRFLMNQIRREFGFHLVPVILELREGKR